MTLSWNYNWNAHCVRVTEQTRGDKLSAPTVTLLARISATHSSARQCQVLSVARTASDNMVMFKDYD